MSQPTLSEPTQTLRRSVECVLSLPADQASVRERLAATLALLVSRYRGAESIRLTLAGTGGSVPVGEEITRRLPVHDELSVSAFLREIGDHLAAATDAGGSGSDEEDVDWQVALDVLPDQAGFEAPALRDWDSRFDLVVTACLRADGVAVRLEPREDILESWMLPALPGHLGRLWQQLDSGADRRVGDLALLTDGEYTKIVLEWNDTGVEEPAGTPIPDVFEENMARFGDGVAVIDGDRILTYRDLRSRANRLARHLKNLGAGHDVPVAVFLERSIELVVAMVALQRAGSAYMPLDPSYPADRIRYQVEDSGVPLIVTRAGLAGKLPEGRARVVRLDEEAEVIAAESDEALVPGFTVGHVANVFYTSGSTGKPKGVLMRHSKLSPGANSKKIKRVEAGQGMLLKSPVGFTLILLEVNGCIASGGRLVVVPDGKEKDPAHMIRMIREHEVASAGMVPSMLDLLLDDPEIGTCRSLKTIHTVGESLPIEVQERFFEKLPEAKLIVYYGCTEAPAATSRVVTAQDDFGRRIVIGKPAAGKRVYILDRNRVPLPVGVAGEIYIGGTLSKGYLNRDALTTERFQDDPFSPHPGARVYRTGDLGRWLPDGNLEILGRTDFQVQVRGVRIELGEIEDVLRSHDSVRDAIVHPDQKGGQVRLHAYVTPVGRDPVPVGELRERIRERLPEYMMPAAIIELPAFPLNVAGKIDRLALPKPQKVERSAGADYVGPRTPTETRLCQLWAELLEVDRVGIEDDFLDLGGDSFLAVRLLRSIREIFGSSLEMPDLFAEPKIRALAGLIDGGQRKSKFRWLISVRYDRSKPPTHAFSGSFVFAYAYTQIMERLRLRFPVYTVSIDWKYANLDYSEGVPELARHHVDELLEADPVGPYRLAGYSFGGIIAYEMACQIRKKGRPVEFLVLLDSTAPYGTKGATLEDAEGESGAGAVAKTRTGDDRRKPAWERFRETPFLDKPAWLWQRRGGLEPYLVKKSSRAIRALVIRGLWPSSKVPDEIRKDWAVLYKQAIWRRYKPDPYDGDMIVFGARHNAHQAKAAWSGFVKGRLDCRALPVVDHGDVLKAPEALEVVRDCLDQLLADSADGRRVSGY